jgi:hypothetical protein
MGAPKFNRNYMLIVNFNDGSELILEPPFTIEFDINRQTLSSTNAGQIRMYNLSPVNRNKLRFDFSNYGAPNNFNTLTLYAGYGDNLPIIFTGNINQAWSVREGVDFITTVQCYDGGLALVNGNIPEGAQFPSGIPVQTVYQTLMGYLPNVNFGAIGPSFIFNSDGSLKLTTRANSYSGNAVNVLSELSGNGFFIDNGKSYILGNNESIIGQVTLIDASSGLLNTPLREQSIVTFDMIFEPGVILGQYIQLFSLTYPQLNSSNNSTTDNVNGFYKITAIKHKGMISPSVCGEAITSLQFFLGPQALKVVPSQ